EHTSKEIPSYGTVVLNYKEHELQRPSWELSDKLNHSHIFPKMEGWYQGKI
ncbi:hypothetical protein PAXRUDRAFT_136374, partial [Paxillus rubicundulus Ve08.2h10]